MRGSQTALTSVVLVAGFPRAAGSGSAFYTNDLTVDVKLVGGDGATLATKSYPLQSLGRTQVSKIVRDLGVSADLSGARLMLLTPTPGGGFAAYASAIDDVTNDPRTLLPRKPSG